MKLKHRLYRVVKASTGAVVRAGYHNQILAMSLAKRLEWRAAEVIGKPETYTIQGYWE